MPSRSSPPSSAKLAGAPVELERPADPTHGDYATNVALRMAPQRGRPPRELAEEIAQAVALEPERRAGRGRRPRLRQPLGRARLVPRVRWRSCSTAVATTAPAGADPRERVQVEMVSANPTGPITVALGAQRRLRRQRSRACSTFAGHDVEREYYYNDAGAQMERFRASVEAARRGEEPPEDGYRGRVRRTSSPRARAIRCRAMLERIEATLERFRVHFDAWALQSALEQRLPELLPRLDTYETDGAVWARSSAYGDDEDRVLIRCRSGRSADLPRGRRRLPRRQARARLRPRASTSSAPTITARATGTARSRGCSATTRSASRCCSTSSST